MTFRSRLKVELFYHYIRQKVTSNSDVHFMPNIVTHREIYPWTALSQ